MRSLIRREIKIFLTFLLIYSFFIQWSTWNEESRFALTRAVIDENRFEIDSFHNLTGDISYYKNHYYTTKMPGSSILATPIYTVWRFVYQILQPSSLIETCVDCNPLIYYIGGTPLIYNSSPNPFLLGSVFLITSFTSSLFSALTVLLLYKMLKHFTKNEKYRILITLIYGLGTLAFPHALFFTNHGMETFFGFLSFYILLKVSKEKNAKKLIFLSGVLSGIGIFIGFSIALTTTICLIYLFFIDKRKILVFLMGVTLGILPLLIYNYSIFRNPFEYAFHSAYLDPIPYKESPIYWNKTIESKYPRIYSRTLTQPRIILGVLAQILFLPSKGILFYYPILIFSFLGLFYMYKENKLESILILFLFALFSIFISIYVLMWWGGWSGYGLRYILPVIPFLMIPLTKTFRKIGLKVIILPLCISILVNFLLLQYGEDTIHQMGSSEYEEKLKNFQVLSNPLLDHYLPLFLKNGPRSILFENLLLNKKVDIRLTPHSCDLTPPIMERTKILLFILPFIGIVALKLPFLSLVPIIIAVFLIWKKEILKDLKLLPSEKLIVFIELAVIFILLFISSSDFIYGENWHSPEFNDGKIDADRWMSQNSTIQIFNREQKLLKKTITFGIEPFNKTRTVRIYLNGKPLYEDIIENKMLMKKEIDLVPGLNEITFNSAEGCEIPTEIGLVDCDLRCLSFKIGDIQIINEEK